MEEENKKTQAPPAPKENQEVQSVQPKPGGMKSKWPFAVIILLLLILIPLGGYFVMNQTKTQTPIPTPPPPDEPAFEASPTPEPTKAKEMKTFTSQKLKDLGFSGYSLEYPLDWVLSENRDETTTPISTVTLIKEGYTLKIYQAATGGAGCIYEGDLPEGPASDYRTNKYKDLESFATLRQTETPSGGKMSYAYCQKNTSDGSFGQPTSVGHMSASTPVANPDPAIVSELEKIVESIKTL